MRRLLILILAAFFLASCTTTAAPPAGTPLNLMEESPSPTPTLSEDTNLNLDNLNPIPQNTTTSPMPNTNPTPPPSLPQQAIIRTSKGDITVKLFPQSAPTTVANFAALSQGTIDWIDPRTGQKQTNTPLYNNTIFHRVIKDFMIQGGDPLGTGTGGPGYKFKDEIDPSLTFAQPYMLAMANSGPDTNGSQFFITVAPTPWLNGKHTIFGVVTAGQDVVDSIANSATDASDKPLEPITISQILISQ